jgi:hypothetical protein
MQEGHKAAFKAGLRIYQPNFRHLAWGEKHKEGKQDYVAPLATAPSHQLLTWGWKILEVLPKRAKRQEPRKRSLFGLYLPLGEARRIETHNIDPSVEDRRARARGYRTDGIGSD